MGGSGFGILRLGFGFVVEDCGVQGLGFWGWGLELGFNFGA